MTPHEALKAAVEERRAQAEAAQAADLNGALKITTSTPVAEEKVRATMAFWQTNTSPAFVIRQCERDLKVLERHHQGAPFYLDAEVVTPELQEMLRASVKPMCAGHGHLITDPQAVWPCPEIRDLAEVYQINLGVSDES